MEKRAAEEEEEEAALAEVGEGNLDYPILFDNEDNEEEEDSCFASEFYRCGSDWSCLLKNKNKKTNNKEAPPLMRRLKQTNLLQMWGFQKMNKSDDPNDNDNHDVSSNSNSNSNSNSSSLLLIPPPPPPPPPHQMNNKSSLFSHHRTRLIPFPFPNNNSSNSNNNNQPPRVCPFYKKIPGTPFTVDAFRYGPIQGCSAYLLTHFHSDHYGGLNKGWSHGPIYCTSLTARLLTICLSVNPIYIRPLEIDVEYVVEGVRLTMLEANHCPGAALIHFLLPDRRCYLHTGDFRASKLMQQYPLLLNHRVNVLYLDTTYCNPKYRFPCKEDVLSFVTRVSKNCLKKQPKTLVIVGAYSIGKECVYLAISKALGVKIYANAWRRRILQSFDWPELSGNLCTHGKDTPLHVLPISNLKFETLEHYLKSYVDQYTAVLAFRPTGWAYSETIGSNLDLIKPRSKGFITIYGVPYSEHSSFTELKEFVQFVRPDRVVPTVNMYNAANRDKMQSYFREWMKG